MENRYLANVATGLLGAAACGTWQKRQPCSIKVTLILPKWAPLRSHSATSLIGARSPGHGLADIGRND